jgi:methylated-DNA-[protein]-cysteine S-methyltransferase
MTYTETGRLLSVEYGRISGGGEKMKKYNSIVYVSPYGKIEIGYDDEAIVFIKLNSEKASGDSQEKSDFSKEIRRQFKEYFDGKREVFDLPLKPVGTVFQQKVWDALREIPYGETRSYLFIATKIGNPRASRAVGMANNKNPIPIIIPCHRVIGANGKLVGYAGGLEMKKGLLELERENVHS